MIARDFHFVPATPSPTIGQSWKGPGGRKGDSRLLPQFHRGSQVASSSKFASERTHRGSRAGSPVFGHKAAIPDGAKNRRPPSKTGNSLRGRSGPSRRPHRGDAAGILTLPRGLLLLRIFLRKPIPDHHDPTSRSHLPRVAPHRLLLLVTPTPVSDWGSVFMLQPSPRLSFRALARAHLFNQLSKAGQPHVRHHSRTGHQASFSRLQ